MQLGDAPQGAPNGGAYGGADGAGDGANGDGAARGGTSGARGGTVPDLVGSIIFENMPSLPRQLPRLWGEPDSTRADGEPAPFTINRYLDMSNEAPVTTYGKLPPRRVQRGAPPLGGYGDGGYGAGGYGAGGMPLGMGGMLGIDPKDSSTEESDESSSSGDDSDEEEFNQARNKDAVPTAVFAVGAHGATGMQGNEMVNGQEVSSKHSKKMSSLQKVPYWAQVIGIRLTVFLFFMIWFLVYLARGFDRVEDRVGPAIMLPEKDPFVKNDIYRRTREILWADSELVREPSEQHEYNVQMLSRPLLTMTPSEVDTDTCLVRIVNTCDDSSLKCSEPSIKANFEPVFPVTKRTSILGLKETFYRDMLGYVEKEIDPRGRKNIVVGYPWGSNAVLPENIWNPTLCEMYLVVPKDAEVNLWMHKVSVVAKNVTLRSLTVQGVDSLPKKIEILARNLTITTALLVSGSAGRVSIRELNAASQANLSISMVDSSIDITSLSAPKLVMQSVNKAVCMVGPMNSLNTSTRVVGNLTRTIYSSTWDCANRTESCSSPWLNLVSTGRGAIAFHALTLDANGLLSEIPQPATNFVQMAEQVVLNDGTVQEVSAGTNYRESGVYCGSSMVPANRDSDSYQSYFVSVDHSNVRNGESELAIISISGPGMNYGNVQVMWVLQKIWLGFEWLWPLWLVSYSIVFPTNPTLYEATISFCPAHGPLASKDLMAPLIDLTDGLGHERASTTDADGNLLPAEFHKGYWLLRNLGGTLDALHKMTEPDGLVPPCDYCAKRKTHVQTAGLLDPAVNGALRDACSSQNFPERALRVECSGNCSRFSTPNRFALVEKGTTDCYENWAVAATLSNNVSFPEDSRFCWTAVDGTCQEHIPGHFLNQRAWDLFYLSVLIGVFGGFMFTFIVFFRVYPTLRSLSMVEYLVHYPGSINQLSETILYARHFCLAKHHAQVDLDSLPADPPAHQQQGDLVKRTKPSDEVITPAVLGMDFVWRQKSSLMGSGQKSRFEKATVKDMVSSDLIKKLRWLSTLRLKHDRIFKEVYDAYKEYDRSKSNQSKSKTTKSDWTKEEPALEEDDDLSSSAHRHPLPKWIKSGINYGYEANSIQYWYEAKNSAGLGEMDILIPRSGGVIHKIEHTEKGIPAPSYLKESNWTGQARVYFVKPLTETAAMDSQSDADHSVEIVQRPVLQHGAEVDQIVWKDELQSGRLRVFYDEQGTARCDMNATFENFQTQLKTSAFLLHNLHQTFSAWYLMEIPYSNLEVPTITNPSVNKQMQNHPFLNVARELYYETVHDLKCEMYVIATHVVASNFSALIVFVSFNVAFYIRIWEFGPRDLDEGGPIQDKYEQVGQHHATTGMLAYLSAIASAVSISVSAFMMVSAVIYYFQPRNWEYREVVSPYARGTLESFVFIFWAAQRAILKPLRGLPVVGKYVSNWHKAIGRWEIKRSWLFPVGVKFDLSISDEQLQEILEDQDKQSQVVDNKLRLSTVDKVVGGLHRLNEMLFALLCFLASTWFVMVCVWTLLGMFLNPNKVGPFFAAATGFIYHIVNYYRELESMLKEAKMQLKKMMQDFRKNLQAELLEKAKSVASEIDKIADRAMGGLASLGATVPHLPSANALVSEQADGDKSVVLPEFARELLDQFAVGKIKADQLPTLVQKKMMTLVNEKLEEMGLVEKFEFFVQISGLISQGNHQAVKRILVEKIWYLCMEHLEQNGFPASVKALVEQVSSGTASSEIAVMIRPLEEKSDQLVDGLVKVLTGRGLAGPESMQAMLRATLQLILRDVIRAAKDGTFYQQCMGNMNHFRDSVLKFRTGNTSGGQSWNSQFRDGLERMVQEVAENAGQSETGVKFLDGLEFLMQMSAVSGSKSFRCWAILDVIFEKLLAEAQMTDTNMVNTIWEAFSADSEYFRDELTRRVASDDNITKVFKRLGLGEGDEGNDNFKELKKLITEPIKQLHNNKSFDDVKNKYHGFINCDRQVFMEQVKRYIAHKLVETFKGERGKEMAATLKALAHLDRRDKEVQLSLLETEMMVFADSEVRTRWTSQNSKVTKAMVKSQCLSDYLRTVLYAPLGTRWIKVDDDKAKEFQNRYGGHEITNNELMEKLKNEAKNKTAEVSPAELENFDLKNLSKSSWIKVDSITWTIWEEHPEPDPGEWNTETANTSQHFKGLTFDPVFRDKLEPLFITGLVEAMKQSCSIEGCKLKGVKENDQTLDSLIDSSFQNILCQQFYDDVQREFVKTALLELFADKWDGALQEAFEKWKSMQTKCCKALVKQVERIIKTIIVGSDQAEGRGNTPMVQLPEILQRALAKVLHEGLTKLVHDVKAGNHEEIRLAATSGNSRQRRKALLALLHADLDILETFVSKDLFNGSLRTWIRSEMETKLNVWLVEALGLENLKIQILSVVNTHVDQLCAVSLPALGIPISDSLSADIKSNLNNLIEKASSGALDPDGKIARLIEISESMIMKDYRGRTRAFLKKRIPEKKFKESKDSEEKRLSNEVNGGLNFETASKWTRPRKLLYGRVDDHRNFATEKAIAQAETELYSMTFCLGILAEVKNMYDQKGIMKRLMLVDNNRIVKNTSDFVRNVAPFYGLRWDPRTGEEALERDIKSVTHDHKTKEDRWNMFMPRLAQVLEELNLAQGDVLDTLKIFKKVEFANYLKEEKQNEERNDPGVKFADYLKKNWDDRADKFFPGRVDTAENTLYMYSSSGGKCYIPPLAKPKNKHEEARLAKAMNMGTILANLHQAVSQCAEAAAESYAKAVAPGVLAVIFRDGLGIDVDPPSKSVERLALALKAKLSRTCKLLGSNHYPDFETVFEQVEKYIANTEHKISSIAGMCMNDLLVHGPIREGILAWLSESSSAFILNQLVRESLYDLLSQNLQAGTLGAIGTKIAGDALGLSPVFVEKMQLVAKASIKLKDVTDLEVVVVLSKLGLSQADILVLVCGSALMLSLIFIFLFLGMGLFTEGAASDGQAVINSLITAGSAVAFNANASAGGGTKLKELLNKAMEYVRKMQGVGEFSFDVNEDCAGMLNRASDFQKKKEQKAQEAAKSKDKTPMGKKVEPQKDQDSKGENEPQVGAGADKSDPPQQTGSQSSPTPEKRKRRKGTTRVQAAGPSVVFCNERMRKGDDQWLEISTETSTGASVKMIVKNGHMSKPFVHCTPGQVFDVHEHTQDNASKLLKSFEVPDNHTGCKFVQILDSDGESSIASDFEGFEYKAGYNAIDSDDELEGYM